MSEDVKAREKALLDEIHELRLLRDAQDPAGALHLQFQRQIEVQTRALLELRANADEIAEVDRQLAASQVRLGRAVADEDPWAAAAGGAAIVGCVILLLALWLDAGAGWLAAAAALLGFSGAALSRSVRYRRDADARLDAIRDELSRLAVRRDVLMGQRDVVPRDTAAGRPALPGGTA